MKMKTSKKITRVILILLAIVTVLIAILAGKGVFSAKKNADIVGTTLTQYEMTDITESDVKGRIELSKSKITIINMWETTCSACIEEMPYLESMSNKYEGDVQIVGICTDTMKDGNVLQTISGAKEKEQWLAIIEDCLEEVK